MPGARGVRFNGIELFVPALQPGSDPLPSYPFPQLLPSTVPICPYLAPVPFCFYSLTDQLLSLSHFKEFRCQPLTKACANCNFQRLINLVTFWQIFIGTAKDKSLTWGDTKFPISAPKKVGPRASQLNDTLFSPY